jgi:hypothetical protein
MLHHPFQFFPTKPVRSLAMAMRRSLIKNGKYRRTLLYIAALIDKLKLITQLLVVIKISSRRTDSLIY